MKTKGQEQRKVGFRTESGFEFIKKIESLDEFWNALQSEKSIYARHRMYPTAFFRSWNITLISNWMNKGWFFIARKDV
jgi:hypothetical protein